MLNINIKYNFGDILYVLTDVNQQERILTGVKLRPEGIIYLLSLNNEEDSFYDFEISKEIDILKKLK